MTWSTPLFNYHPAFVDHGDFFRHSVDGYPLVMTNGSPWKIAMALIEIDGLPFLIAWWIFPVRELLVITRWYIPLIIIK